MRTIFAAAALLISVSPVFAASWVITNDNVKKECGACHMAFQPQFLPARSWQAIMSGLSNHFGEDASLTDPAVVQDITTYLVENAGDVGKPNAWVRRIPADQAPLRITELPRWISEHSEEVSASAWKKAGTKSNCIVCHRGADQGNYVDD